MNQVLEVEPEAFAADTPAEETPTEETPPLVWVRDGIPDAQLHQVDPKKPGKTVCKLSLYGRFRPASSTEVKTRRRCPQCWPAAPQRVTHKPSRSTPRRGHKKPDTRRRG